MKNVKIYIDEQRHRKRLKLPFRLRVMNGDGTEAKSLYFATYDEAERVRSMMRKVLTALAVL